MIELAMEVSAAVIAMCIALLFVGILLAGVKVFFEFLRNG